MYTVKAGTLAVLGIVTSWGKADIDATSLGSVGNVADVVSAKLSQHADMLTCRRHVGTCRPDMSPTCGLS